MITLSLPILSDWKESLQRWASEIRTYKYLEDSDFAFQKFEPALSVPSGTLTVLDVRHARYLLKGKTCSVSVNIAFSSSGTPNYLIMTLPFPTKTQQLFAVVVYDNGNQRSAWAIANAGATECFFRRYDSANFTAGTVGIFGNFFYEID